MPFLSTADIAGSLEAGFDSAQVDRLLLIAEAELRSTGLVFDDPAASTREIKGTVNGRRVFNITPARLITSVQLTTVDNILIRNLTEDTDYYVTPHRNISGYAIQIELLDDDIYHYDLLKITAKFGMFVDFTATSNYEQRLLRAGIIDWVRAMLKQYSAVGTTAQNIQAAKTAGSQVSYFSRKLDDFEWSILRYQNFKSVIDWFYA